MPMLTHHTSSGSLHDITARSRRDIWHALLLMDMVYRKATVVQGMYQCHA